MARVIAGLVALGLTGCVTTRGECVAFAVIGSGMAAAGAVVMTAQVADLPETADNAVPVGLAVGLAGATILGIIQAQQCREAR